MDLPLAEDFIMTSVPDFFQEESEEALRSRVEWLEQHLGLRDSFFVRLLGEDSRRFLAWRRGVDTLPRDKEEILRDWWQAVLHLLSFQGFDEARVRALLERTTPERPQAGPSAFSPPWTGSSMKEYLESHGSEAIEEVARWVESFRFGDPYASPRKGDSCLSTRP
jgi:hypothetical protein